MPSASEAKSIPSSIPYEIWSNSQSQLALRVLSEQIDLQVSLAHQKASIARAKISWATALQDALQWSENHGDDSVYPLHTFHSEAMRAFHSITTRTHGRELGALQAEPMQHSGNPVRPPRRRRVTLPEIPTPAPLKLLFIQRKSPTSGISTIMILTCPECDRTSFTTVQGLINHARLAHSKAYGTHEECLRDCAREVQSEEEQERIRREGIEVVSLGIPSIRSVFERAVGASNGLPSRVSSLNPTGPTDVGDGATSIGDGHTGDAVPSLGSTRSPVAPTHLSITLGHHAETPALAPFLGKEVLKRTIRTDDPTDSDIDIVHHSDDDSTDISGPPRKTKRLTWKYQPRSRGDAPRGESVSTIPEHAEDLDLSMSDGYSTSNLSHPKLPSQPSTSGHPPKATDPVAGSRFHISRRFIVSDWSQWVPEERRSAYLQPYTHRWMVSVASPSYGEHISTFLSRVTVIPVPDLDLQSSLFDQVFTSDTAPFSILYTTFHPFLARITLYWVGDSNPPTIIEHWIGLNSTTSTRPVLGEEQAHDVELDRNTIFLPPREGQPVQWIDPIDISKKSYDLPTPTNDIQLPSGSHEKLDKVAIIPAGPDPDHEVLDVLNMLVAMNPLTSQDIKARVKPLHKPLVRSRSELMSLVYGRRKALECKYTRSILMAFQSVATTSHSPEGEPGLPSVLSDTTLATVTFTFVYRWLEAERIFPRHLNCTTPGGVRTDDKANDSNQDTKDIAINQSEPLTQSSPFENADKPFSSTLSSDPKSQCPTIHEYCMICGKLLEQTGSQAHSEEAVISRSNGTQLTPESHSCLLSTPSEPVSQGPTRAPLIGVETLLKRLPESARSISTGALSAIQPTTCEPSHPLDWESEAVARKIVASANPHLTIAIRSILRCSNPRVGPSSCIAVVESPIDIAPFALLGILTKLFMENLIRRSLNILEQKDRRAQASTPKPISFPFIPPSSDRYPLPSLLQHVSPSLPPTQFPNLPGTSQNHSPQTMTGPPFHPFVPSRSQASIIPSSTLQPLSLHPSIQTYTISSSSPPSGSKPFSSTSALVPLPTVPDPSISTTYSPPNTRNGSRSMFLSHSNLFIEDFKQPFTSDHLALYNGWVSVPKGQDLFDGQKDRSVSQGPSTWMLTPSHIWASLTMERPDRGNVDDAMKMSLIRLGKDADPTPV